MILRIIRYLGFQFYLDALHENVPYFSVRGGVITLINVVCSRFKIVVNSRMWHYKFKKFLLNHFETESIMLGNCQSSAVVVFFFYNPIFVFFLLCFLIIQWEAHPKVVSSNIIYSSYCTCLETYNVTQQNLLSPHTWYRFTKIYLVSVEYI